MTFLKDFRFRFSESADDHPEKTVYASKKQTFPNENVKNVTGVTCCRVRRKCREKCGACTERWGTSALFTII
eukprot:scaffold1636_cov165-Ochromonas_danica.AAC.20